MTSLRGPGDRNFNAVSHKPTRAPIPMFTNHGEGRFATKKSFHGREIFILNYTESERSKFYLLGSLL